MKRTKTCLLALMVSGLAGCATYYRVADPTSEKVYYTRHVQQSRSRGFVKFKDDKTDAEISLQSSEVAKISKYEYKKGMGEPTK